MKSLSYIALIAAAVSFILALVARYCFDGKLIFNFFYYITGTGLLLLASIALALQYLINIKSKDS